MALSMQIARRSVAVRTARVAVRPQAAVNAASVAKAAGLGLASLGLALAANAATVKLGADSGALVFSPDTLSVASGETIDFVNNAGFPHNVVFDEDEVPDGVDADALSREDYLNGPGETYSVKLTTPGTYGIYCEPHQGAGMKATITVN